MSKKVLQVLGELNPSGAEVMIKVAYKFWARHDFECEIASIGEYPGIYAPILEETGYRLHHVPFKRSILFPLTFYIFLRRNKFDIVHIHTEQASFWLAIGSKLAGTSVIRTIHSVFSFRGLLRLRRMIQRRILNLLDIVQVSIGPSVKNNELKTFNNQTQCIYNWYDNKMYYPAEIEERDNARKYLKIDKNKFVVLSVGNCAKVKNHIELLKAIKNLPAEMDVIYLHVGKEEQGFPERELANHLGISPLVYFLGYQENIRLVFAASDVFVMPSLYEGFGIAALEAMGSGLPTVLSNVQGLRDLKDIVEGIYWVKPESSSIGDALYRVWKLSHEERLNLGLKQSIMVSNTFTVRVGTTSYCNLYERVLQFNQ